MKMTDDDGEFTIVANTMRAVEILFQGAKARI